MSPGSVQWELLPFYHVVGANQSAHICAPVDIVVRCLDRMINQIGLPPSGRKTKAGETSRLQNYADIRLKTVKSQSELTKAMTKADRTTEGFRKAADMLKILGNLGQFERVVSFDFEAWELGTGQLTELGISVYYPAKNRIECLHFVIEENLHLLNGSIMPNHRDQFQYGKSTVLPLLQSHEILLEHLTSSAGPVAVVGHGIAADLTMILDAGLPRLPLERLTQIDTQAVFLQVDRTADTSRLEHVLQHFKLPQAYLHNAGNDALYTLLVCLRIAGLDVPALLQTIQY